jgi:putative redox protein
MEKVTAIIGSENYKTTIKTSSSEFITDMPEDEGGKNTGPKPKELLGAALAGCVTMTVKMYANRSNWPLEEVHVDVEVDTETNPGTTIFRKKVSFTGDLTEDQIKRLHLIASKCPINKLLQSPITVETL